MTTLPEAVFVSPPFVDLADTDAPLIALVPSSIWILPDDAAILERFQRSIVPLPEIVILRTGRTRAVTTIPLIVPEAVPGNTSFQLIFVVSAPLHCTVPLPIIAAFAIPRPPPRRD